MYMCKESQLILNELAIQPTGDAACFKVHYWGVAPKLLSNPVHKHSFFEVCYVLDGVGEYTDNGIDYPLHPGIAFCSRPGIEHQIRTGDGLFLVYTAFEVKESASNPAMIKAYQELVENNEVWKQDVEQSPTALLWRSLLIQENGLGNLPSSAISSLAYALLLSFLTLFGNNEKRPVAERHDPNMILKQAKLYILDNLSQPLSLREVASYVSVSERHLSRLFSANIHESFTQFIHKERIRQAAALLMDSDLSIKEIAEATGFSSVHYFSRMFAKEKQQPPGKFRKRLSNL
jgi:AraC-like DNA-binding protein/mannose-6-phosphate isomerase-like protein (cupin superfamily)